MVALRLFLRLLVSGGPAWASDAEVPEEKLTVTADRDHLLLGTDREASLRIGGPADLTELEVVAQVGQVTDIRRVGPGRFTARYQAPSEPFPRVAIIVASARLDKEPLRGWTRLPLWGAGKAVVRSRPGANVRVRIAEEEFGPVRADRQGQALVPIVVPPGVRHGYDGHKKIDLHLPPWTRAHVVPERSVFRADLGDTIPLRIYAITESGEPLSARSLRVESGRGRAPPAESVEPGVYVTRIEVPPGPSGPIAIEVEPEESSSLASLSITARPGPPAALTLQVPPGPFRPGQTEIPVVVTVADAVGNPTRGEPRLITNLGFVLGPSEDAPGRYTALAGIPTHFEGKDRWRIEARLGGETAPVTASVPLLPDAPASVVVRTPNRAVADGSTSVEVMAEVRDRYGNLVTDAAPEASASRGSLETMGADKGRFSYRWTPPADDDPGREDIRVRLGTIEKSAGVHLAPSPRLLSLAAKAGYLHGTGNLSTPALAVEVGVGAPVGGHPLWLLVESGWERSHVDGVADGDAIGGRSLTADSDVIPLVASAGWRPRLPHRLVVSATLGAGLLAVASRVGLEGQPTVADLQVAPVLSGAVGMGYRYGPGYALIEGRYRWAATADRDSHQGPLSAAGIQMGYAIELF